MKRVLFIITVIICVLFIFAAAAPAQQRIEKGALKLEPIMVFNNPKQVQLDPQRANIGPSPPPLPAHIKLEAYNQVRKATGQPAVQAAPPARVILTPGAAQSGSNLFDVYDGANMPSRGHAMLNGTAGYFFFRFQTVPGKTYLIDISLLGPLWICSGAVEGQLKTQGGHLIAGFRATSTYETLLLKPGPSTMPVLFRAELTQVD
jgi:hypothetical protein